MDIQKLADIAQDRLDREIATNPDIRKMIKVVEDFLYKQRVMCYGGTAINNLLPDEDKFYDPDTEIPDYDFYSETPQLHALMLADIFTQHGYKNIEVKPGVHLQTFKVFVDFTGIADITYLERPIFGKLWKENTVVDDIHYVTPNFLRLSMYLELSRPRGDVTRWEKVYNRLMLLNKNYPIACPATPGAKVITETYVTDELRDKVENELVDKDLILIGVNAAMLNSKDTKNRWNLPVDILSKPDDFDKTIDNLAKIFEIQGEVSLDEYPAYAELLPKHVDINDKQTGKLLVRVFETMACHSYHEMRDGLKIGSIPTLLQFFFSFLYADSHFLEGFDENRIICITQRLVDIAHSSKGAQRFKLLTPLECIGKQESILDMRQHSSHLRSTLKRDTPEFLKFFMVYRPSETTASERNKLKKSVKNLGGRRRRSRKNTRK